MFYVNPYFLWTYPGAIRSPSLATPALHCLPPFSHLVSVSLTLSYWLVEKAVHIILACGVPLGWSGIRQLFIQGTGSILPSFHCTHTQCLKDLFALMSLCIFILVGRGYLSCWDVDCLILSLQPLCIYRLYQSHSAWALSCFLFWQILAVSF